MQCGGVVCGVLGVVVTCRAICRQTSLLYASRVKLITNNASKNAEREEVTRLKRIIANLKAGGNGDIGDGAVDVAEALEEADEEDAAGAGAGAGADEDDGGGGGGSDAEPESMEEKKS